MKNTACPKGFYEFFTDPTKDSIRVDHVSNLSFLAHMHVQIELVYVLEGEIHIQVDDLKQTLPQHAVAFIAPHKIHSFHTPNKSQSILTIFNPLLIPEIDHLIKHNTPQTPFVYNLPTHLAQHFYDLISAHNTQNLLLTKGHLSIILATLLDSLHFEPCTQPNNYMIQTLLQYIYSHYQEALSLESLSTQLGLSKFYISHLFNQEIGCSLSNYINYLRVNKAKELLLTDKTITEIAYECGFESSRSFYRAFTKFCEITPVKYRKL